MAFHISIPSPHSSPDSNRRKAGRIRCDSVRCSMGEVLEFSSTGARIRSPYDRIRPGDETTIEVDGLHERFTIPVRVVWVALEDGTDDYKHVLAGLQYLSISDPARAALTELARAAASNPTVGGRSATA